MGPTFNRRHGKHRAASADVDANFDVQASDAFLTELSRGIDPSDGSDELAALFLELRTEVEAPMPAAPELPGPCVVDVEQRRAQRGGGFRDTDKHERRFRTSPWFAGVVGAAAATVVVAGTGAALYNATPGSALWGPSEAVFGEGTNSIEFASALDEIEDKTQSGDIAGARVLIEQLRESLNHGRSDRSKRSQRDGAAPVAPNSTAPVSHQPQPTEKPAAPVEAATVTVTPEPVTQTVTVTETAAAQGGVVRETSSSVKAPSTTSTIPTTTKMLGAPQTTPPAAQSSQ